MGADWITGIILLMCAFLLFGVPILEALVDIFKRRR